MSYFTSYGSSPYKMANIHQKINRAKVHINYTRNSLRPESALYTNGGHSPSFLFQEALKALKGRLSLPMVAGHRVMDEDHHHSPERA